MNRRWGSLIRRNGQVVAVRFVWNGVARQEALPWDKRTTKDAELLLAQRHLELERGLAVEPSKTTVGEYLRMWLATAHPAGDARTANTRQSYEQAIRRLAALDVAGVLMQKLTLAHCEQAQKELREPLSPKSVNHYLKVAQTAWSWAIKRRLATENPWSQLTPLALPPSTRQALEPEQAARLLEELLADTQPGEHAKRERDHLGQQSMDLCLAFLLVTGRRRTEACGLRWQDADLEHGTYTVNQAWLPAAKNPNGTRGAMVPTSVKDSKHPRKTYELSDVGVRILKQQARVQYRDRENAADFRRQWNKTGLGADLVFTSGYGEPVPHASLTWALARACERAAVPALSIHELRHTAASLAIYAGATQWEIMALGGWKSLDQVEQHYGHLYREMERGAVDKLGELLTRRQA